MAASLIRVAGPWVLLVAVLSLAGYFSHEPLRDYASSAATADEAPLTLTQRDVTFIDPPEFLGETRLSHWRAMVAGQITADPFAHDELTAAAESLDRQPWIEAVDRIVRLPDGRVAVHAAFRQPVAMVAMRDGYHLVDPKGLRLPDVFDLAMVRETGMKIIRGVAEAPPNAGQTWHGGDLTAALMMLALVMQQDWADQVVAIDVSNYQGRVDRSEPAIKLLTRYEPELPSAQLPGIVWGRPIGRESHFDVAVEQKLEHIAQVARTSDGRIDANGAEVHVYNAEVSIRPLP